MQFNLPLFASLSATLLLLSACSLEEQSASESGTKSQKTERPERSKSSGKSKQSSRSKESSDEMDLLVLAPPQLTLEEAIKKYASAEKLGVTVQEKSMRLTKAATRAADMGDTDAAEVLLNEALRLDSQNGEAYFQRGRARCNSVAGKDKAAIEDLRNAIRLGAGGARTHITLARLYDANNQQEKAIDELGLASKVAPKEKDIYKARAAIYAGLGQKENALKDYAILMQLHPGDASPHFRAAQILETMKRDDEARAHYLKVTEHEESRRIPLKPLCYKRLAAIDSGKGKHKEAISSLTEAWKLDKTDDEPLRLRGMEYATLKDFENALADLNSAIELSPEAKVNFEARAKIYDLLGKTELAEKDRSEAKRLNRKPAELPIYDLKKHEESDQLE